MQTNWDELKTVTLTSAQWTEIKCALWDSYGKWQDKENESMTRLTRELRDAIHDQIEGQ
jgi:hypothetical protein